MAVVTVKSGQITNRDALPRIAANAAVAKGDVIGFSATTEVANGDSIASKYILASVPSSACGILLKLYCDAITSAAADVGIYRTTQDGGAVVDVDYFASAQSLAAAITTGTEIQHEADATDAGTGYGLADLEKPLWQCLGLTADPCVIYDIVATLTAAATAAGTLAVRGQYQA
jgi:hypothetical protein